MPIVQIENTFSMEVEYYESSDGWRWRYRGGNSEITQAAHEAFSSPASCKRNFEDHRRDHAQADVVKWKEVKR